LKLSDIKLTNILDLTKKKKTDWKQFGLLLSITKMH